MLHCQWSTKVIVITSEATDLLFVRSIDNAGKKQVGCPTRDDNSERVEAHSFPCRNAFEDAFTRLGHHVIDYLFEVLVVLAIDLQLAVGAGAHL